jgi:glycosyltransferase involved in cell wall biosynthesis
MIYIDFRECIPSKYGKFHGGGNYGKRYLRILKEHFTQLTVFIPTDFEPTTDEDKDLLVHANIQLVKIETSNDIKMEQDNAILFIPLLPTRRFNIINIIKKNNPSAKVFLTIHGTRYLDSIYDRYDKYYQHGLKYHAYAIITCISRFIGKMVYKHNFKTQIPKYDKIFTVSNDSLQKIVAMAKPQYIKPFYQGSNNFSNNEYDISKKENYILFVNANRKEKNFLRTLEAFLAFKKHDTSELKLYVTGMNDTVLKDLLRYKKIDTQLMQKDVTFFDYVSFNEYNNLFEKCKFLLYTSKTEGFGLPLLEACSKGCLILSSWITATPEVLGSSLLYVNPYDTQSIENGIRQMITLSNNPDNYTAISQRKAVCASLIALNDTDFVREFSYD